MSLVFAGVCSHAPGITGRYERADKSLREGLYAHMDIMRAYCLGMADSYEGPVEDEEWLAIRKASIPGNADLSERLIRAVLEDVDVSYAQE